MNFTISSNQPDREFRGGRRIKGRVYISGDARCLMGNGKTVAENAYDRLKVVHPRAFTIALRDYLRREFQEPALRLKWNLHAGCSMCPCSPGYIVDNAELLRGCNVWVDVADGPQVEPPLH